MNLYLRYFDNEVLVSTVDEAIDFLSSIPEIKMTPDLENDIREYVAADAYYPKRYKVRPRVYFIIIKTEAACMADFKAKKALRTVSPDVAHLENQESDNARFLYHRLFAPFGRERGNYRECLE